MSKAAADELNLFISITQESFRKLVRKHKIALCVVFLAVFFIGTSLSVALESLFYLSPVAKISIILLLLMTSLGATAYAYKQLERPSFKDFYRRFSKSNATPQLSNALDLHFDSSTSKTALGPAAIYQNVASLEPQKIARRIDSFSRNHSIHTLYRIGLMASLAGFLLLIAFIILQPSAVNRLVHPWNNYSAPNPYNYTVEPGNLTLEQGQSFTPKIYFKGEVPEEISLAFKTNIESEFRRRKAISTENGDAVFASVSPNTDARYFFMMDGFRSDGYRISVQLRPRFEQLSLQLIPPPYTTLDTTLYAYPFSKVQAYPGSKIVLKAVTNKPVSRLSIHRTALTDSDAFSSSSTDSIAFSHQWTVTSVDTVTFEMRDHSGLSNKNKFRFIIEPVEDQHPFVSLIEPSENLQLKTPESLQLKYEAGDDFGLTSASLHYSLQRAFTEKPQEGFIKLPEPVMNRVQSYHWEIPKLDPKPRDVLTFWIEVKDNDAYNGAKTGRSRKLMITFPSITEYLDELDAQENKVGESLENISKSFNRMQQEYDQFKQQLKQNPDAEWEQKQSLQDVQEQQQKIDKQLEKLNEEFRQIRDEIEENSLMSAETMEAYNKLQQLMKEINNPELAEALEKLRQSLSEMNPLQLREALKNYEFNEKLYRQRIQRTIELFKSLKLNSNLEKMAIALERLAEQEQQLVQSSAGQKELNQQKAIQKSLRDVQKELNELVKNAPNKAKEQIQKLQKNAGQKLGQITKDLNENIEQLKQQNALQKSAKINRQQQGIQKQMQQMAQQMHNAKQQLNQQRKTINTAALKYILYSLINLSQNQEELAKETESLPQRSKAFVKKARKEQNIAQQFSMLSDSLFRVSSELPGFSNQINKRKIEVEQQLQQAVEMLAERDKTASTHALRRSLGGINELAVMIATLLDQLQNQQGGGSGGAMSMQQFIEQMQKMSGQQQQLNQRIQNMINDIQGNRLTQSQMERLNQLARQQNKIRKQLKALKKKGAFGPGDRILSELERLSENMEEAINDIRGGQLDRQLIQRQQNILSRMLAAEDAVQERGKKEEREATVAGDNPQSNPPDITIEELQQQIRDMLNNPNRTKFREDYQRLIEQYFELLRKQADGE